MSERDEHGRFKTAKKPEQILFVRPGEMEGPYKAKLASVGVLVIETKYPSEAKLRPVEADFSFVQELSHGELLLALARGAKGTLAENHIGRAVIDAIIARHSTPESTNA